MIHSEVFERFTQGDTIPVMTQALMENALTPRILDLPFALFRQEMMMTLKPVPDHVLREIVDDIFIPLVTPSLPRG